MNVIQYQEKYKKDFIQFNTDWIEDNFGQLEKEDIDTFNHIEESIEKGAMIHFAVEDGNVWQHAWQSCWEMTEHGNYVSWVPINIFPIREQEAMNWAIMHGAGKLFILSNSKLKAAIHIYEKYGFHEIKLEDYEYVRGDIAFEYMVSAGSGK